ncbi:MAG: hypothetical protein E7575_00800 [Ruminococcaceae bacterium]|nr:hypothetical protein [Oscillospiraceae bacterium]
MKRYRNYKAKKLKLPRRIIFFVIIGVAITVFTVILGNILRDKLEKADIDTSEILSEPEQKPNQDQQNNKEEESASHNKDLAKVLAGCMDLTLGEDKTAPDAYSVIEGIKNDGYNAVSFCVFDEGGKIAYASPALEEYTRLPSSEKLIPYDTLRSAIEKARNSGLRSSAVFTVSESSTDELIIRELCSIGFDEIVIRGFEKHTRLDNELVSQINGYILSVREIAQDRIDIGICFEKELYMTPSNAPYIEKIYDKANFLAIDFSLISPEDASAACADLQGSFSAYLMRPLIKWGDEESSASLKEALANCQITALQYIFVPNILQDTE